MEIVLGVSMTPTTVSIALVEGEKADGVIIEHDVFDISAIDGPEPSRGPDHVVAAIQGTQEGAIAAGHHLVSTGVTWTDHAEAALLREALVAHGIDDVLLASELHAAAALAQAVGRAVGYDKTGLLFVERDAATLAVVETDDGAVVKVLRQHLERNDAIAGVTDMLRDVDFGNSVARALFVVGSGVDVTAVKAHLKDLVSVPVIVPEEPRLALARGAALAAASAPRYDTSTIGLAYSLDPDETTVYPMAPNNHATTVFGAYDASADTTLLALDATNLPDRRPFMLMGSTLTATFVAGVLALVIAVVVNVRPTADQGSDASAMRPSAAAPAPAVPSAPSRAPQPAPTTVPQSAPAAPPAAAAATTARLLAPPPPPPRRVIVHDAAPAPPAPHPPVALPPPPVVIPPVIPAPVIQWLPPILQPPQWLPGPVEPPWGNGGGEHGGGKHGGGKHGVGKHGD
ncbi:hypothetical protein A5724_09025 [Mycobacterium sp. ACS1612]|uniref:DUF7159 family protein n=1 Tax=Mycobacterium sp. ACS1612 TaxID=1834117 RepID=UPI000800C4F1|nr:hypothetical protein [Mycobacterium sp. ACS1612]OBF38930.1 hypothetical protein A5724_09025 [Mycobacterium sp. ACS1612]